MSGNWDYIIVGGGSAGCVLANRLTADRTCRVLVLEAGGWDISPYLHVPAGRVRLGEKYDWNYPAVPDPSRLSLVEPWASGKVLGGSSSTNGMMWARGAASDYDQWAEMGCEGWDYASLLPYFRRSESFIGGSGPLRGGNGPQSVDFMKVDHPLTRMFVDSAISVGHKRLDDYCGNLTEGVALGQVSQKRGLRHSASRAYLWPVARRRNLKVQTRAHVQRIVFDGQRAVGVEFTARGATVIARCNREVLVSAGAIGSPTVLLRSGVGPRDELEQCGIPVIVDSPAVGKHLHNHVYCRTMFEVDIPTLNRDLSLPSLIRGAMHLVVHGTGNATAAFGHAFVFASTNGARVDTQIIFGPFGVQQVSSSPGKVQMMRTSVVTALVGLMEPRARGSVTLDEQDASNPPVIQLEHLGDSDDVRKLIAGIETVREIFAAPPIRDHVIRELSPGPEHVDPSRLEEAVRRTATSGKHYAGSCRMGPPGTSVVDSALQVHGASGLRLIDMSVTPHIPAAPTYATALVIGEVGADAVLGTRGRRADQVAANPDA